MIHPELSFPVCVRESQRKTSGVSSGWSQHGCSLALCLWKTHLAFLRFVWSIVAPVLPTSWDGWRAQEGVNVLRKSSCPTQKWEPIIVPCVLCCLETGPSLLLQGAHNSGAAPFFTPALKWVYMPHFVSPLPIQRWWTLGLTGVEQIFPNKNLC